MATTTDVRELSGLTFRCLEGCGFCCTFPPEVSRLEQARLRDRLRPSPLPLAVADGRAHLALHDRCGACALLTAKTCTQYDLRPAHCRYFPFHVHFAERPEIHVNYTCRGIDRAPEGDLADAYAQSVTAVAAADAWARQEAEGRATFAEFKRRALKADAWGDARAAAAEALDRGAYSQTALAAALDEAGVEAPAAELHADALAPFGEPDVVRRPFYLAPDLRWLTFERAPVGLRVLAMDERGALTPDRTLPSLDEAADLAPPLVEDLLPYARRLVARGAFVGQAHAIVDDEDYALTVPQGALLRLAETGADLALRVRILQAMGVPDERLADEAARFYDATFLDAPTIGGWL